MNDNKVMEMYGRRFTPLAGVLTVIVIILFALFLMFAQGRNAQSNIEHPDAKQPVSEHVMYNSPKPLLVTART